MARNNYSSKLKTKHLTSGKANADRLHESKREFLRVQALELAYKATNKEIDLLFENANLDGLDDLQYEKA